MSELPRISGPIQDPSLVLGNIKPITRGSYELVRNRTDLDSLIEAPALPACQDFYDKNIRTVSSSANGKKPGVYIDLDFASLSDENKQIVLEVGVPMVKRADESRGFKGVVDKANEADDPSSYYYVHVSVEPEPSDTQETVQAKLLAISHQFTPQKLLWAPTYTLEDLKAWSGYELGEEATIEEFTDKGFYFDPETERFHESKELFEKSQFDVD